MKKIMIATVLLASLTTVQAQENSKTRAPKDAGAMEQRSQDRAEKQTDTMVQELGLDKGQAAKVKAINERFTSSLMEMRNSGMSEDARKERSQALRQQHNAELKAVLTPEQFEKFKAQGKERRAERGDQMNDPDPAKMQEHAAMRAEKRTSTMTEELGLSADQSSKVEAINATYAASMAKLKQAGLDEDARKEQMKQLRETRDADLKAVLTPEQHAKMLELRKAKHAEGKEKQQEMKKPHNE